MNSDVVKEEEKVALCELGIPNFLIRTSTKYMDKIFVQNMTKLSKCLLSFCFYMLRLTVSGMWWQGVLPNRETQYKNVQATYVRM